MTPMTLASWFSSMRHSRGRLTQTGARRKRSGAFRRHASFDVLEDRFLLSSTVNFDSASESVNESTGTFSIPVTVSGTPAGTPTVFPYASGFDGPNALAFDAAGNLYVANSNDGTVDNVTPTGKVSLFASGFSQPDGLAFDAAGNLYVANISGIVSKVTPEGMNTAFARGFNGPVGLAFDTAGNLYVANTNGNTVSEVTPAGKVSTFASGFNAPFALTFDSFGNLYVANFGGNTVSKVTPAGKVSTFASGFDIPDGLAVDSFGNLYVANFNNTNVSKVTSTGAVSVFATPFDSPLALAFDSAGNLYVASVANDTGIVSKVSQTVVPFTLGGSAFPGKDYSGVTPSPLTFGIGQTTRDITGTLLSDPGPALTLTVTLGTPTGGAVLGTPSVNTLTINEPPVVQFSTRSETVSESDGTFIIPVTVAETPTEPASVPFSLGGSAASGVAFSGVTASPLTFGVGQTTVDITGTLLSDPGPDQTLTLTLGTPTGGAAVGSPSVNTLTIAEPTAVQFSAGSETINASAGTFSIPVTVAGTPTVSTLQSGFDDPFGLAVDAAGNLYVANTDNNTVSELNPAGQVIATLSGFNGPFGLAVDSAGNLYVANAGGDTVSELNPGGQVIATVSGFSGPAGLAFDSAGNLYVVNSTAGTVSKVTLTPTPVVSTFASGFVEPFGLAFDAGNLYVANADNDTVSKVTPAGVVSTFASGLGGPAGLAFDSAGNLYVSNDDGTVSEVTPAGVVSTFAFGFNNPAGLAFHAGNLYVTDTADNTLRDVTQSLTVPFTLGGSAAAGVAFSGVTAGLLSFTLGQTTQDITGRLLSDPGPTQTLTFTLGTPAGGRPGQSLDEHADHQRKSDRDAHTHADADAHTDVHGGSRVSGRAAGLLRQGKA